MDFFPFGRPKFLLPELDPRSQAPLSLPLVFGNVLLLLAHKILYPRPYPKDHNFLFIALGLMAGLAWWVNYLSVAYILPVALFIFLKDKTVVIKAKFPLAMGSFFRGQPAALDVLPKKASFHFWDRQF